MDKHCINNLYYYYVTNGTSLLIQENMDYDDWLLLKLSANITKFIIKIYMKSLWGVLIWKTSNRLVIVGLE